MAKPRGSSNNVRAGAFVLGAITIGFAFVVVLGGVREKIKPRNTYTVRFTLLEGATGLDVGSPVRVAGRTVGRISEIELRTEPEGDLPAAVDCTVKVDKSVRFFGTPVAYLNLPLLGSGGDINFAGVGSPTDPPVPTDGTAVIRGTMAPPAFLAQAGYGEEQKSQLQNMLRRGDEISADVKAITGDFKGVAADVREKWPTWSGRADNITKNVEEATASLPGRIEDFRQTMAEARQWITDNKDKLTRIVDNVDAATNDAKEVLAHFNAESVKKVDALLDSGKDAMEEARAAVARVDGFVAEQSPTLRRMLANFRLGSDQLKLTLAEVRRSPWRLLYRPDTQELEFELLYDSARAYAEAVSDLRAAGESLDAASARAGAPGAGEAPVTPGELEALAERLRRSMETYGAAENAFLKLLVDPTSKAPEAPEPPDGK